MSGGTERLAARAQGRNPSWPWVPFAVLVVLLLATLYPSFAAAQLQVTAARMWPAPEYTRVTIESSAPIQHTLFTVTDPFRLVVDLEGVEPAPALEALGSRVAPDDPHVRAVRVGRFKPDVLRIVFDLKAAARAEAFTLKPVGEYAHRLVLDIHPAQPYDSLMALVEGRERAPGPAAAEPRAPAEAAVPPAPEAQPPTREADRAAPRARPARPITIVIDPGHGGEDPGARGRMGTNEKDITLSISKKLKTLIDAEPGMRAVLTRNDDYFVALHTRVEKARRATADLFVSVHADAFIKPHARGSSVFALSESGATSAAARWLAKRENDADLIGGVNIDVPDPYLRQTLLDLSQTATINDSLKLGRAVLGELGGINTLHKSYVEQAGFAVLKAPDIPSILVETAFISNPDEEKKLRDDAYQTRMAQSILTGIKRYLAANPPLSRTPRVALSASERPPASAAARR
ncbi:MAG: N-acetylmuramoyl-L-alanine amidase [Burkholderiales bacterium]|nr:N-acetylmuramoyl-L-alanine amidase [Burkholderiales bacterium]